MVSWVCPMPLRDYPNIIMGHGGGGKLSAELVEHLIIPAFGNGLGDAAVVNVPVQRLAVSTDSFVVQPLFFPGGSIGELAIHGTVNDVAMSGATPLFITVGFIIEEGLQMDVLGAICERMGAAAAEAGVQVVAGDTKVVDKGHGDGLYINTSGVGALPEGVAIGAKYAQPGDVVIVSGTIGDHGMAIMAVREGLAFETAIESDTVALNGLVAAMVAASDGVHVLRDPTRGGVASALNEIAATAQVGITLEESKLPVQPAVHAACELLGLDPLYVANEGKLLAIVVRDEADAVLAAMHAHPHGQGARIIGEVVSRHPGMLTARTAIGGTRVVDMQVGEQLPRIC